MRFVFCAAAVCRMLGDEDCSVGMDVDAACDYILSSISYDGGIGQVIIEVHNLGNCFSSGESLALAGADAGGSRRVHLLRRGNIGPHKKT